MKNATNRLLDELAEHFRRRNLTGSDYQIAKDFGVSKQHISAWRRELGGIGDPRALEICELVWPGDESKQVYWLAELAADREQNERVKSVWQRVAESARAAALVVLVGFVGLAAAPASEASARSFSSTDYVLCAIRRWLRRLAALVFIAPLVLFQVGCSTMHREAAWLTLHAVDVAQTINGPAQDPCFEEVDNLTRSLIGAHPSTGEALAWGAGVALIHAGVTWSLERANAPGWLQIGWQAVTIVNTSYSLVNNHREGIRPFGSNDCPHG